MCEFIGAFLGAICGIVFISWLATKAVKHVEKKEGFVLRVTRKNED